MKPSRRKFLSLLGVSTAAGPLAVRAAAESEIANLTALKNVSLAAGVEAQSYPQEVGDIKGESPYTQAQKYIKLWGKLPQFVDDNIRERAKNVSYLDPDIACKKSWSLNVKIVAQRERNYQNEIKRYVNSGAYESAQSMFRKLT
jgi:hypothetical protein